jgi:hypothetical protein
VSAPSAQRGSYSAHSVSNQAGVSCRAPVSVPVRPRSAFASQRPGFAARGSVRVRAHVPAQFSGSASRQVSSRSRQNENRWSSEQDVARQRQCQCRGRSAWSGQRQCLSVCVSGLPRRRAPSAWRQCPAPAISVSGQVTVLAASNNGASAVMVCVFSVSVRNPGSVWLIGVAFQ